MAAAFLQDLAGMIDGGLYAPEAWETCGVLADMLQDGAIVIGPWDEDLTGKAIHILRWINTHRRKPFQPHDAKPFLWFYAPPARFWNKTIAPNRYYVPCHVEVYASAELTEPETLGGAYVRLVTAMLRLDNETLNKI